MPQEGWALGQWLQASLSKVGKISSSFIVAMTIRLVTKTMTWLPAVHDVRFSLKLLLLAYQKAGEIFRHGMHARTGRSSWAWLPGNRKQGIWEGGMETGTILLPPGSFSQRAKAEFSDTKALRKMLEKAQGKRTSAEHIYGQWASLPPDLAPKVLRESRATHRSCGC